jgi:glycosyltransferase involved in cell wall biosynthesis
VVHFRVGRSAHPFFAEQLRAAPPGFSYEVDHEGLRGAGAEVSTRRIAAHGAWTGRLRELAEPLALRALSQAGVVRRAHAAPGNAALVHSAQFLLADPGRPYVMDFECLEALVLYQRRTLERPWARARLRDALLEDRCRMVLPWTRAAARGLSVLAAPALADRTEVVLPAIAARAERPRERAAGPLRALFIGTAFYAKGGLEALRAVARAREDREVCLDVISDVPERLRVGAGAGITVHAWPAPGARVAELFAGADVLLFPSHMDTLGFVMLEAMALGMPVLVCDHHFAAGEIVEDGVSGIVVAGENALYGSDGLCRFPHTLPAPRAFRRALECPSPAYVDRLAAALLRLAGDPDEHARLAAGALARVREGALSLERRREQLGRIYRAALS